MSFSQKSPFTFPLRLVHPSIAAFLLLGLSLTASAQSSSSSSSGQPGATVQDRTPRARIAQPEASGSAVTLETSEPLFDLAVALNACGYDSDLASSSLVRTAIRGEVNEALQASPAAQDNRDALCGYVREHTLADEGRNLAQYISLALYLTPPPELAPSVSETELPPDSTQIVNILPLLRTFSENVHLHALWAKHRPEYEDLLGRVHDPLTRMILNTNIYLRQPVSSYDGRRFLVLLEPMLAPSAVNARYNGSDSVVVVSPSGSPLGAVRMEQIRHTYLHYEVEPLVYARAAAMDRLLPLLKPVQEAPLDFTYKSDIVALLTECLIKAVEDRTMDVNLPKPVRPDAVKQRTELGRYDAEMSVYDRKAEEVRRQSVELAMRQGWVLVEYFYTKLAVMEKDSISLKEYIGEMIYGMDVERERHHDQQIVFLPEGTHDLVKRSPRQLTGFDLAEMALLKGDTDGASAIAEKALNDPSGDHAMAHYVLARVSLMQRQPGAAIENFQETLKTSKDPRTLAWSHIYLGRLYDVIPERQKAIEEYKAALSVRDGRPDTKVAAENGTKSAFVSPKSAQSKSEEADEAPLDPSGKAEKDAYRPPAPK